MKIFTVIFLFLISNLIFCQATAVMPHLSVPTGNTLDLPINLNNFNNIGSITFKIQYPIANATFIGGFNWNSQVPGASVGAQNGIVSIAWASVTPANISSGKLVDLRFTYLGGSCPITFQTSQCEVTDANNNIITVIYINGSLPVEFTSFTGITLGNSININWVTATETNNKGFEVQEKGSNGSWNTLTFISGAGTSVEKNEYNFVDKEKKQSGVFEYRIKQIDLDGNYSLSKSLALNIKIISEFSLLTNFPNPFNPSTTISYNLLKGSQIKLIIYNLLGEAIKEIISGFQPQGNYQLSVNMSDFPSGIYLYYLQANSPEGKEIFKSVKKMMLMK